LSDFEKDILISYAHIDDEALIEGQKGWIAEFHRSLEVRLAQLLGQKPKIWRDPKLQGNDFFGDEIVDQFPQIALLVSILSPRYVNSKWCTKEVLEFYEASQGNIGIRIGNKSRIFKVIKTPVSRDLHPDMIRDTLGYEFYQVDPDTGRAKEFGRLYGSDMEQAFWAKLDDLAHDMSELLQEMKSRAAQGGAATATTQATDKPAVYLAQTSSELRDYRDEVKRDLQEHGYTVLPDQHLPHVTSEFIPFVNNLLTECALSVHLFGNNFGMVPEGTQKSTVVLQNELAAQKSRENGLPRLIWLSPEGEIEDDRQASFIELLRNDPNLQYGSDIFESAIGDLKFAIHDRLKQLEEEKEVPEETPVSDEDPKEIYLICDEQDMEAIRPLDDYLYGLGYNVILPVFDGDAAAIREEHQESLKMCDAALIYYGEGNELWMRSKSRDFMKIAGYGRKKPMLAKGVFLANPSSRDKERFRAHDMIIMNGTSGFSENLLEEFIAKLK
jgi:hypothetical protein